MIQIFQERDKAKLFARLESRKTLVSQDIVGSVRQIVSQVQREGDRALLKFTEKFDKIKMTRQQLRLRRQTLQATAKRADPSLVIDLEKAIFNIHAYHSRQIQKSWEYSKRGVVLGQRVLPLDSVGVYVPGGSAAYPSSVLMNIIPAKIAGVRRIVVVTPPGTFQQNPVVAAALRELNATEVYLVGGAQAIAALAYGTETIPRVDKIVGPGNAYVTAAKREVFGQVDIDMIAGPSEVVDPRYCGIQSAIHCSGYAFPGGARRSREFHLLYRFHAPRHAGAARAGDRSCNRSREKRLPGNLSRISAPLW